MRPTPEDPAPDDDVVSRVVPRAEVEATLDYWTPEQMDNAKPG